MDENNNINTQDFGKIILDCITIGIAIISLVFSIVSFSKSNSLAKGEIEIEVRNMITNAKYNFMNVSKEAGSLPDEESKKLIINMAYEEFLNSYDEACAKYLDGKIDKKRFKKTYNAEIRKVVENPNSKKFLDAVTSNYRSLLKVYDEWNNLEK